MKNAAPYEACYWCAYYLSFWKLKEIFWKAFQALGLGLRHQITGIAKGFCPDGEFLNYRYRDKVLNKH